MPRQIEAGHAENVLFDGGRDETAREARTLSQGSTFG